ncbi:hypothetical protein E0W72_11535 [Flavobacterium arcticum]|uniref:DUF5908 family protein n=1 Tax=Flavobacterium arcticum TaxID=1784713 RepID=UPI0013C2CDA7|nr:DUF5908 family protein [Flavobacterium arcticum]KAF2507503.1 hypothetical protein E0W72_11535 [Flavobacterium arcticum]
MPIEIRELIIKTEIVSAGHNPRAMVKEKDLQELKKQMLEECKRIFTEQMRERSNKR